MREAEQVKAPTNIYGPDGTLCKAGEDIPTGWHDEMPDLATHLDALPASSGRPARAANGEAPVTVSATATIGRKRARS